MAWAKQTYKKRNSKANTNHLDRSIAQLKNAKKHELMEISEDE